MTIQDDIQTQTSALQVVEGGGGILSNPQMFEHAQRVCRLFADSDMVPDTFKNKPSNVFVAYNLSRQLGVDLFMLMQNMYVVHGKPGMQATLIIAMVNSRGPFKGPIQWKTEGAGLTRSCTAYATNEATDELCEATVTWEMVEKEGWSKKPGSKWQTIPELMFRYRSAAFLARLYCPEVVMGLHSVDELEDFTPGVHVTLEPMGGDDAAQLDSKQAGVPEAQVAEVQDSASRESVADSLRREGVQAEPDEHPAGPVEGELPDTSKRGQYLAVVEAYKAKGLGGGRIAEEAKAVDINVDNYNTVTPGRLSILKERLDEALSECKMEATGDGPITKEHINGLLAIAEAGGLCDSVEKLEGICCMLCNQSDGRRSAKTFADISISDVNKILAPQLEKMADQQGG